MFFKLIFYTGILFVSVFHSKAIADTVNVESLYNMITQGDFDKIKIFLDVKRLPADERRRIIDFTERLRHQLEEKDPSLLKRGPPSEIAAQVKVFLAFIATMFVATVFAASCHTCAGPFFIPASSFQQSFLLTLGAMGLGIGFIMMFGMWLGNRMHVKHFEDYYHHPWYVAGEVQKLLREPTEN